MTTATVALSAQGASKVFTSRTGRRRHGALAVHDVTLTVAAGEFVCFIGPSGCGKTTVLNMFAGSVLPTVGEVRCHGSVIEGLQVGVGYVTQDDTLLPWRTLAQNVEFGLELSHVARRERRDRAAFWIERVGLTDFSQHYPHQLSGGMRKRAALARTLALDPQLVLMDEPFGALDAHSRHLLQADLLRIWDETGKTIVFVTHDLTEAITLADRVVAFSRRPGRIKAIHEITLPRPRDPFTVHELDGYQDVYRRLWEDIHDEMVLADSDTGGGDG